MDLPNTMSLPEMTDRLRLTELKSTNWYIQATSATLGTGLVEGFDWLSKNVKAWEGYTDEQNKFNLELTLTFITSRKHSAVFTQYCVYSILIKIFNILLLHYFFFFLFILFLRFFFLFLYLFFMHHLFFLLRNDAYLLISIVINEKMIFINSDLLWLSRFV